MNKVASCILRVYDLKNTLRSSTWYGQLVYECLDNKAREKGQS